MKSYKQVICEVFSTKSVGIIIFIATLLALTGILSGKYYMHHSIIENGVSKKDVIANKTVRIIDEERTQKLKNEISKKILPILVPIQDDFITNNLDKDLNEIDSIKELNVPVITKKQKLIEYFNITDDNTSDLTIVEYLSQMSNSHFDKIEHISKNTLSKILADGISESDIQDNFDKILTDNTSRYLAKDDYKTVTFLIKNIIAPNIILDEEATETSKKNALNSVKPVIVTYRPGDKIVSQGQIVSKLQKDALRECGYNVIQLNVTGIIGIFLLVFLTLFACAYHIENYEPDFKRKSHYALISLLMILISAIAVAIPQQYEYLIILLPVASFSILMAIFFNPRTSLIASLSFLSAIALALQFETILLVLFAFGLIATGFAMKSIDYTKRLDLIRVGLITSVVYVFTLTAGFLLEYNLTEINFQLYFMYLIASFANGIFSAIIASGLLPVLEAVFGISTTYGLMELANSNHPLLQKLREKAPGTDHHSQMVAILAQAAAEAIGANAILAKIGSLYHDVGKINRPLFFIENQSYYGIENPHEQFSPKFSKMVITTHPKDGVDEAKKYNIPPIIYPFILEHHGDSVVSYFYNEAIKQEGAENVSEEEYRYNAPRPSSRESAIVMLADGVESAVRSLKNPSFEEIDAKVNSIINKRLLDGQLSDSPLTLKDLKVITATFNRVLKGMHHQRIKYHEDFENIQNKVGQLGENKDEH